MALLGGLIFLVLIIINTFLCKYILDIFSKFITLNIHIKTIIIVLCIIIFMGSCLTIFRYRFSSIIVVFFTYTVGISMLLYLLNTFLKGHAFWDKIYLFIPLLLGLLIIIYGLYNMKDIVMTTYNIHNKKINDNYKAILISDLHYGVSLSNDELQKYCDDISKLNPDFVFLAGDIVDEKTTNEQMKSAFKILGSINTKYGIYYTYGNHDKSTYTNKKNYTVDELKTTITDNNITILDDDKKYINDDILLIGRSYDNKKPINEIIGEGDNDLYIIVIDHIPLEYKSNRENGVNLELSGHTHNGQIFPLGLAQKVYNKITNGNNDDSLVNNIHKMSDMVYGKYEKDDFVGIVTSGIAGWGIPIRTESKSEYVLINLSK